jgi:6-phosphogluconolactonase
MRLLLAILLLVPALCAEPALKLYVGAKPFSKLGTTPEKGLFVCEIRRDGSLSEARRITEDPATATFDRVANDDLIYATGEGDRLVAVNRKTGKIDSELVVPNFKVCYLATNSGKSALLAASIGTGHVHLVQLAPDGTFTGKFHSLSIPKADGSKKCAPHCAEFSPDERFAFVADIAGRRICRLKVDLVSFTLSFDEAVTTERMKGPRHLTFGPRGQTLYLANQTGEAVTVFRYDAKNGALTEIDHEQSLPDDKLSTNNHIAELKIHPNGRFLYVSNRGHDSIARYQRHADGTLTFLGCTPSGGESPWSFFIHPNGKFLYCSNRKSDNLRTYELNPETGALTPTPQLVRVPAPRCISIAP